MQLNLGKKVLWDFYPEPMILKEILDDTAFKDQNGVYWYTSSLNGWSTVYDINDFCKELDEL